MKQNPILNWLIPLIVLFSLVSASFGLFWQSGYEPTAFTTVHGQIVELAGRGLYAHDTVFSAATSRGTDGFTLLIGIPLLILSFTIYRRGFIRGGFMLCGVLAFFLYYGASLGLDKAYNNLFLVYIGLFSASFYAFILTFTSIELNGLLPQVKPRMPWRGTAIFMIVVGVVLAIMWLSDVVVSLLENHVPPLLGPSTTFVTYTIDVGIISVACIAAGILLLRRTPLGILLSATLNIMLVQIGGMVISQTIFQINAGIQLTPGELIGKAAAFVIMAAVAIWLIVLLFQKISDPGLSRK